MKKIFHICSIFALLVTSFLLFSCMGLMTESGTITINLPGSTTAREIADNGNAIPLVYDISVTSENYSKAETDYGETSYSLELNPGNYKIEIVAKNKDSGKELFDGSADFEVIAGKESSVTVELKKIEIPVVTVKFDAKGGEGEMADITGEKDSVITLPECSYKPAGKVHFAGWTDNADGENKFAAGDQYKLTDNVTLYAIWENNPAAAKVVFSRTVANENTMEVKAGTDIKLSCETADVIIYYKLNDDKEWTVYDAAKPIIIEKDTTITAYATSDYYNNSEEVKYSYKIAEPEKTSAAKVQVVYAEGGKAVESEKITVKAGTKFNITCETKDADLYYQVDGDKDATKYTSGNPLVISKNCTVYFWSEGQKYLASEKVKISFEILVYTVSFDSNGGTGSQAAVKTDYEGKFTAPECTFVPNGKKHFVGWSTDKSGSTKTEAGKEMKVSADVVVYAIWEDNPVAAKVEFIGSDGKVISSGKVAYGTKVTLTSSNPDLTIYYSISDYFAGGNTGVIGEVKREGAVTGVDNEKISKEGDTAGSEGVTGDVTNKNPPEWKKYDSSKPIEVTKNMSITAYATSDYYNDSTPVVINFELNTSRPSAEVIIDKVIKGDLVMEVEGENPTNFVVKSLSGKEYKSYTWLINGVPVSLEPEIVGGEEVLSVEGNKAKFSYQSAYKLEDKYNLVIGSNNLLTCIVETDDGCIFDISYVFFVEI